MVQLMKTSLNTCLNLLIAISAVTPALAQADGFACIGQNTGLSVKIYNHTTAAAGTRTPAILVVADPTKAPGKQTIASFSGDQLYYQGYGTYLATIDPGAYATSETANAIIAGTTFGELKTIELAINFAYTSTTTSLASVAASIPGKISYHKTSGETVDEAISCTRYLKDKKN